jgi:hypothetical protein
VSHRHVVRGSLPVRELEHLLRIDPELVQGGFDLFGRQGGGNQGAIRIQLFLAGYGSQTNVS